MVYTYRVTLTGIKGFYRIYHVNSENSLYSFHKQMRADMEFPQDQLILFKGLGADQQVVARYGLFDLGSGCADEVSLSQTVKKGITSFVYFYDVTNKKSVNITFEGVAEDDTVTATPTLFDVKGPNPIDFENGYVAFEDLPDDQRHLPSESDKAHKNKLASLLDAIGKDDADDEDAGGDDDEDIDDIDDDDDDEDEDDGDEDGVIIYDGSEELTI